MRHRGGVPNFGPPLARRTDPETSHAAARSMVEEAGVQRERILERLRDSQGLTNDEIDAIFGWRTGTASRRVVELVRAGLVERTELTRPTSAGRAAIVHRAKR